MDERRYDADWVELHDYTPTWRSRFEREQKVLAEALGDVALDIQHVGSTSVPGLCAKPIIDIIVGVRSLKQFSVCDIRTLEQLGYVFRGDAGIAGRLFFRKGVPRAQFHLSVVAKDGEQWTKHVLFRDYLRHHESDAKAYASLKMTLASQYSHDRTTYTSRKGPLIAAILRKAYRWRNA
ncbi:GrpB family protein [Alicyclobacillus acidoterrestris]|uniref:GrpB family protein n=1 Tax=Alicyclobacillus acidoterrestris (strain ATCC 49025 / DSM 3922 / CIP 106132 / NCIMB 13137 / GD3B) TaxID=1356854 RepID=A0A9E7CS18_ALIAG|nr:GrpB family protein [Alicyclobacillus acidoterrestris]UNO50799.1 GrpB family protein [Alicyclobacillus acidoterrestris]